MLFTRWLPLLALGITVSTASAEAAVTEDSFLVRNSGDLLDLCSAAPADAMYTAATNFCHGFALGVFRVLQEEDAAHPSHHLFCLPDPQPTRNEGIASFVQWGKANPNRMAQPATDGIATFLSQQYPCRRGR